MNIYEEVMRLKENSVNEILEECDNMISLSKLQVESVTIKQRKDLLEDSMQKLKSAWEAETYNEDDIADKKEACNYEARRFEQCLSVFIPELNKRYRQRYALSRAYNLATEVINDNKSAEKSMDWIFHRGKLTQLLEDSKCIRFKLQRDDIESLNDMKEDFISEGFKESLWNEMIL